MNIISLLIKIIKKVSLALLNELMVWIKFYFLLWNHDHIIFSKVRGFIQEWTFDG